MRIDSKVWVVCSVYSKFLAGVFCIGQSVTMVMGSYENIKITSPEDLNIAEQILNMEKRDEVNSRRRIIWE